MTHNRITDNELIAALKEFGDGMDRPPTTREMKANGPHTPGTYRRRFGSWNDALEAAGFEPQNTSTKLTDADLLAALQDFAAGLDHTPTREDMSQFGPHSGSTYERHFGSWNQAKKAAGLDYTPQRPKPRIPKADLVADLKRVADSLDGHLTQREYQRFGDYNLKTHKRHFGSWNDAKRAAGLDIADGEYVTDTELLEDLKRVADKLDKSPSKADYREHGRHSDHTIQRRFDGWNAAKERVGLDPLPNGRKPMGNDLTLSDVGLDEQPASHSPRPPRKTNKPGP